MDKKIRIIILILGVLLVLVFIFLFMAISSKEALIRQFESERQKFIQENEALTTKTKTLLEEKNRIQQRLDEIRRQLDQVSQEKENLEKKYAVIDKEREELIAQLKKMKTSVVTTAPSVPVQPVEKPVEKPEAEDKYWAGVLKEKANLEMMVDQLKNQVSNLKLQMEELKNVKSNLELELKNVTSDKEELERKLSYTEKMIDSISLELVREKKEKRKIEEELKSLKSEHRMAIRRINSLNEEKLNLEKKIQEVENKNNELGRKLKETTTALEKKILEAEEVKEKYVSSEKPQTPQAVELPPIVVHSPEIEAKPSEEKIIPKGKVLAVNKEYNFIIIDLGTDNGVNIGDLFEVYRDNQKIANIEVIQTRRNVSACEVRQQTTPLKVGDIVK